MNAVERAESILASAYALAARKGTLDPYEFKRLSDAKASEIRDFLQEDGVLAELDKAFPPDIAGDRSPVALLGRTYDDFARGVIDATKFLSPSPTFVALKTFVVDQFTGGNIRNAAEYYGGAAAEAVKNATKPAAEAFRAARPYLIAAGGIVAALAAAYVWRSFK